MELTVLTFQPALSRYQKRKQVDQKFATPADLNPRVLTAALSQPKQTSILQSEASLR